jgi:hypothetical protein
MVCTNPADTLGCGEVTSQRVRYFTGRHLTAADFRMEQEYHRSHRYLHNRVLHGWGIACGLWVVEHPNEACRTDHVAVKSGIAIDCCGREIVICQAVASPPVPWDRRPQAEPGNATLPLLLLCLTYQEQPSEKVPVIFDSGSCTDPRQEFSRYTDSYALCWRWIDPADLPHYGWRQPDAKHPKPQAPPPPRDDCGRPKECTCEGVQVCQVQCPPDHCIPLAVIPYADKTIKEPDMSGRPRIRPEWHHLTHISWYNWTHGGEVTVSWLRAHGLRVTFDRDLQRAAEPWSATGINRATFRVEHAGEDEVPNAAPSEDGPHMEDDWTAVYKVDDRRCKDLVGDLVVVTIRCDFVLDCHGQAVDGNHLGALVPTGDGLAGGDFVSWFTVIPDSAHETDGKETYNA